MTRLMLVLLVLAACSVSAAEDTLVADLEAIGMVVTDEEATTKSGSAIVVFNAQAVTAVAARDAGEYEPLRVVADRYGFAEALEQWIATPYSGGGVYGAEGGIVRIVGEDRVVMLEVVFGVDVDEPLPGHHLWLELTRRVTT